MPRLAILAPRLLCLAILFQPVVFALAPSTVTLTASPNPSNYGQPVLLTATVTSGATGKVTFYDGTTILGVGTVSGTQATLSTVMLASGKRLLRAHYSGDTAYTAANSTNMPQTVVAATSLGFHKAVNYVPNTAFNSIAVGDFNGDSRQDLAMASPNANAVTVFLGSVDGTFPAGFNYPVTAQPSSVVAADFNGDGKVDLAVGYGNSPNVSVLLGNGDGTFQAAVDYPAGTNDTYLAVGDFNGDGVADLVCAGYYNTSLSVLLGNGDGTFRAPVQYAAGNSTAGVVVADFNGDGKADLAIANAGNVVVLPGNGDGTFGNAIPLGATAFNYAIAAADLNGDGKADLVVLSYYSAVAVLLGNDDGTFQKAVTYSVGSEAASLALGDFDGDGNLDMAVSSGFNGLYVLFGNGDGTFKNAVNIAGNSSVAAFAVGDFNGDGKTDLIAAGYYSTGFNVLLGGAIPDLAIAVSHDGGFTEGQQGATYTIAVPNVGEIASSGAVGVVMELPANMTAASIGGSGWTCTLTNLVCTRSDSVAPGAAFSPIIVKVNVANGLTGNATSTFAVSGGNDQNPANNIATDTSFVRLSTATALAASPNPSVLGHAVTFTATVTTGATGSVAFYAGTTALGYATLSGGQAVLTTSVLPSGPSSLRAQYEGDSNYGPSASPARSQTVIPAAANGYAPVASYKVGTVQFIATGDFNSDGKPDLIAIGNSNISVLAGNGDGTFRGPITSPIANSSYYGLSAEAVGDFNGDGRPDVVVSISGGLNILLGNSDGTFQAAAAVSSTQYNLLAAADFNNDGKLDLVAVYNGNLFFLAGNGDGTFQPPVNIATNPGNNIYYYSLLVADVNGDGKPDLITSVPSVLLGNGDGTFQPPVSATATSVGQAVEAVGDFNGDGNSDLAVLNWTGIQVLLSNGTATLNSAVNTQLAFTNGNLAVAGDFNGDGKLDIAASGYGNNVYLVFGNGDGMFQYGGWGTATQFSTDGNIAGMVAGDFNGDGKPDLAVATSAGTVDIFLGGQFSGLGISLTHNGNFTSGQTGTYQVTVQNRAFVVTSGAVTVTDTLPFGLSATALSGTGWTCTLSTLTCTRSDALGTGASYPPIAISVNIFGLAPTVIANRASVAYGGIANPASDPTTIVLPTTTTLAVSPSPSSLSQTVTMTATVTAGAGGTILFADNGVPLGTAILAGGHATFSTALLPSGLRALTAAYSGDSTHAPSASAIKALTVNAGQTSGFSTPSNFATAAAPSAIAIADFNHDGVADLVTANSTANNISVLLGNGDGTFGAHADFTVGTKPVAVVVADFNNDGIPDVAVVNQTTNNVSVLLGNGNGTFQTAVNYPTGNGPNSLAAGDLNSDGKVDLLVGNGSDGTLTLLFGNGDGTFHSAASTTNAYGVSNVAIGDFNRDGKPDIAYTDNAYSIYVLPGNGDGTFGNYVYVYLNYANGSALGDLNADGNEDIVSAGYNFASVALGNGDGTFKGYVSYSTTNTASAVTLADVNGDGKLDVVALSSNNSSINVLLGNGDGTLQAPITYPAGSTPVAIVAGDFNGDGRTDFAFANSGSNNVTVLLGVLTPVLSLASQHTGPFSLGQTGATYSITLTNNGPGVTSGAVTVTDTLPAGLTATAISGTGWACTLSTTSCTRSDTLGVSAGYPAIVVTVSVTASSTSPLINEASASGGNAVTATTFDLTTIVGPATTIQTNPTGLQFTIDGGTAQTSPQTLNLAPGTHTIAVAATQPGPTGSQYAFTAWSDSPAASHSITVGNAPSIYTASFKTQYLLTATINPWPGGTVSPPSATYIDAGTNIDLTATPTSPYLFTSWSGGAAGSSNPMSVSMNAPLSVTATFDVPGFTCKITGDNSPSVADVQLIVNEALGAATPQHDLNRDHVVNVADVQKLIAAALNYGCPY